MPTKNKLLTLVSTEAQIAAVEDAAQVCGMERSAFIREAIRKAVEQAGIDFPEDLKQRGKYDREIEAVMAEADRLTDYGRNDPTE